MERFTATCEAMAISHIVRYQSTGKAHIIGPRPEEHTVEVTVDFLATNEARVGDYLVVLNDELDIWTREEFEALWGSAKML